MSLEPQMGREEIRAELGLRAIWDAPITMDDGVVLRADVFLPKAAGRYPVIMTYGPYAKGLAFQDGYASSWERMVAAYPEVTQGSTGILQSWETVDPEKWVPEGYACVRVDSRGAGRSPGRLDTYSERETRDFCDCIRWAAEQPWSSGRVGLNGISYHAVNQWLVACRQPPHLAAICVWEGAADHYRDMSRHGGILSDFCIPWFAGQVASRQHGVGERGARSRANGALVSGPETLPQEALEAARVDPYAETLNRPFVDTYYRDRTPDFSKVMAPLLSAANWGGMGMHTRGNFEGFQAAGSPQKWLEVHGDTHFGPFYRAEGIDIQKRFFGHFLKGDDTGWGRQPPVQLAIRHPGERFVTRGEQEWPLARTRWTRFYLEPGMRTLGLQPVQGAAVEYDALGDGLTFSLPTSEAEMEITGPCAARLFASSDTTDADLFLALRLFDPDGQEVLFVGTNDPRVPVALGWLRASHRKIDAERSLPYRPFHTHDEAWPLTPGEPVELLVEIWPTSIVIPPGFQLRLDVRGKDYENGLDDAGPPDAPFKMTGVGPFTHTSEEDRPPSVFGGRNRIHFDAGQEPYLLLPIIPGK